MKTAPIANPIVNGAVFAILNSRDLFNIAKKLTLSMEQPKKPQQDFDVIQIYCEEVSGSFKIKL